MNTFRRHVIRSTNVVLKHFSPFQPVSRALDIRSREVLGCSKVYKLDLVALSQKDVLRFDISVDYVEFIMQFLECSGNLIEVVLGQGLRNCTKGPCVIPQFPFLHELHLDVYTDLVFECSLKLGCIAPAF